MLRLVGVNEYGIYSLSSSVIGYLALLYTGMTSTYLRYYSTYKKEGDEEAVAKLNSLFVVLFSALGCCAFILGIIFSANLRPFLGNGLTPHEYELARILFVIMAVNMALLMPKTVFSTLIISGTIHLYQVFGRTSLAPYSCAYPAGTLFRLWIHWHELRGAVSDRTWIDCKYVVLYSKVGLFILF